MVEVGTGVTFIVTVIGTPTHPFAVGVIVYIAEPGFAEVAVNVCTIEVPLPVLAPETLF